MFMAKNLKRLVSPVVTTPESSRSGREDQNEKRYCKFGWLTEYVGKMNKSKNNVGITTI